MASTTTYADGVPVWIYVIFRKNPSAGHESMSINISQDGPVFWNRHVIYAFCCSCHFEKHEVSLSFIAVGFDKSKTNRFFKLDKVLNTSYFWS
uniref:Uncharacterized protein n=1 Tax=Panagrolaimus sp. ES5 TaxID=591445 RepID=A0AC34GWK9_9BILA